MNLSGNNPKWLGWDEAMDYLRDYDADDYEDEEPEEEEEGDT